MRIFIDLTLLVFNKFKFIIFFFLILFLLSDSKQRITSVFKNNKFNISNAYIQKNDFEKLVDSRKWVKTIKYAKEKIDPNALFLLFKDAEFPLYVNKKFITYLDPSLLDAYKSESDQILYKHLKNLNIAYIYVPSHNLAVLSNTRFLSFIGNPHYTELLTNNAGYRLYKIKQEISNEKYNFSKQQITVKTNLFKSTSKYLEYQTRLYSPKIDIDINRKYLIRSLFSGIGNVRIIANESDANGTEFSWRTLETHLVDKENNETLINNSIYIPSKKAQRVRFIYAPSKDFSVQVQNTKIYYAKEEEVPTKPENITLKNKMNAYLNTKIKVKPNREYYIKSDIIGNHGLTLYVQEYDSSGKHIYTSYLNSVMCRDEIKHFSAIYVPLKKTDYFKLFYRKKSKSKVTIYNHSIYDIDKKKEKSAKQ